MAFIPSPDCAKAVFNTSFGLQAFSFGLWFEKAEFDISDMTDLANICANSYSAELLPYISDSVNFDNVTVYDMRTETGQLYTVAPNDPGGDATEPLPIQVALVVTHRTAARGRTARGRTYISGFPENAVTEAVWISGIVTAVNAFFTDVVADANVGGWQHVVVSHYLNGAPRTNGLARLVTSSEVRNSIPGTQRRRANRP